MKIKYFVVLIRVDRKIVNTKFQLHNFKCFYLRNNFVEHCYLIRVNHIELDVSLLDMI